MNIKRLLIVLVITVAVVAVATQATSMWMAPKDNVQPTSSYKDGDKVTLRGSAVCLKHTNTGNEQTLECAMGLQAESGEYYALKDTSQDYSLVSKVNASKKVEVEGVYRSSTTNAKYLQSGTIELTAVRPVNK